MNKKNTSNVRLRSPELRRGEGGFIHLIILFAIFCVIIWYFKIDVRGYIDSHPKIKDSLNAMIDFMINIWKNYLEGAGTYIWNNIIIDIIWKNMAPLIPGK
jgi:hypothetical protein